MGIDEVRLTGGEPLCAANCRARRHARPASRAADLSLTTNGFLLDRLAGPLAAAGLTRINVRLDTLQHDAFT